MNNNKRDNFTDVTLQNKFILFFKMEYKVKEKKQTFNIAARFLMKTDGRRCKTGINNLEAGDIIYGESIYKTLGVLMSYQLPVKEKK
jgi:outer membrane receptor for ferrienterochelin and colicins